MISWTHWIGKVKNVSVGGLGVRVAVRGQLLVRIQRDGLVP